MSSLTGLILGVVGAVGVIVSLFMSWRTGAVHPSDVPAAFLWDRHASGDPSLLVFLIPLAVLVVLGIVAPGGGVLRGLGGLGVLAVCGLFAYQLDRLLLSGQSLGDALDTGFYFAAVGGIVALISALFPSWGGRRAVTTDAVDEPVA